MKKIILWVVISIFFVGVTGAACFYLLRKKVQPEQILREDVLGYVRVNNPQEDLQKFMAAPLWKTFTQLDFDLLQQKKFITAKQRFFMDWLKNELPRVSSEISFKTVLGREMVISFYAPEQFNFNSSEGEPATLKAQWLGEILSNIAIIGRVEPQFQLIEFLSGFSNQFFQYVATESVEYKKHTIYLITLRNTNIQLGFTRIKDLLIIGLGDKMARRSIDVFEGSSPALATDKEFKKLIQNYSKPVSGFFYGNIQKTAEIAQNYFNENNSSPSSQLSGKDFFKAISGFTRIGASVHWAKLSMFKGNILYDADQTDPSLKQTHTSCAPRENKTVSFIPKEVLIYQWGNCIDFNYYWEEIQKEIKKTETSSSKTASREQIQKIEDALGFSIKEIALSLGDEMGGHLADIDENSLIPIPRLVLFIKMNDQRKIENVLKNIFDQFMMPLKEEVYSKIPIQSMVLPLGESVQPSYCFLDQYLLLGINRQVLKQSIDVFRGKALSLAAQEELTKEVFSLKGKSAGFLFLKIDKTLAKMESIMQKLSELAFAEERKKEAFLSGSLQRLKDAQLEVVGKEEELKLSKEKLKSLENSVVQKDDFDALRQEIENKEKEFNTAQEQRKELEQITEGYGQFQANSQIRQVFMDEIISPFLKSFQSFSFLSATTTQEKEKMESILYLKLK